ncbi:hypothetical protein Tco_0004693 [Tanacetum coccineum]
MPPKRTSTSEAPAITQVAIRKLVADNVQKEPLELSAGLSELNQCFPELATLCPTMVPDSEKMIEVFIEGLPRNIEGNVTASKPQTLEEAINIAQRLMDQVIKHTPMQVSSDHKQKFDDKRTFNNNNYRNTNTNTATIITNHNKTKDRKPSGIMLPPQLKTMGILETVPCVTPPNLSCSGILNIRGRYFIDQ